MRFDSNDIWHDIPCIDEWDNSVVGEGPEFFRMRLEDFVYPWKAFPHWDVSRKRERLSQIFNIDYFNSYIVLTNSWSLFKLTWAMYSSRCEEGSGFIYIYTFEDNILAGMYDQGHLWWRTRRYDTKLKIGRTERNALRRIEEQLDRKTSISEPPILLAVFWTKQVVQREREIHQELSHKRLTDKTGKPAKGGVEWFKDTPTHILPTVLKWVEHFNHETTPLPYESLS